MSVGSRVGEMAIAPFSASGSLARLSVGVALLPMADLMMRQQPRPWPPLHRPPEYLRRYAASPPLQLPLPPPALSQKGRDYYFLSPYYRTRTPRHVASACPCSRSRSMEDVRGDVVCEWEPAAATRVPTATPHPYARRSVENLLSRDHYHHRTNGKRYNYPSFVSALFTRKTQQLPLFHYLCARISIRLIFFLFFKFERLLEHVHRPLNGEVPR